VTDRQTDGQTDRRTEFSLLDRVCIACSAVKIVWFYCKWLQNDDGALNFVQYF